LKYLGKVEILYIIQILI